MKPQHFAVLAVAAALSLLVAVIIYSASVPSSGEAASGAPVLPNLKSGAQSIARVEIKQGDRSVVLAHKGDNWVVDDRGGFPANPDKIRTLVANLSQAVLAEPKTRNPARYSLLELEDPASNTASSRLIRLLDDKGAVVGEIIAGKTRDDAFGAGKGGTYVRKPGDVQTWLTDAELAGGIKLSDWTKPRVFEAAGDKIKTARIELAGATGYDIKREADDSHTLEQIPAGKKLKYANGVDNIIEAMSSIDIDDVRKAEGGAGTEIGAASFESDNGLKVSLKLRRDKDVTWVAVTATGEGDAKKAADDIMGRSAGWEFKIPPSKAENILKRYEDLLEDRSS